MKIFNFQFSSVPNFLLKAISYKLKANAGFTLLELVISLAIISLIGAVAGINLVNYQRSIAADSAAKDIVSELRLAQRRAISGEDGDLNGQGDAWGVRFSNPTGAGGDNYKVFYGSAYTSASTTATVYLPSSAVFANPADNADKDIIFTRLTGTTTPDTVAVQSTDGSQTITITVATSTISMQ